MLLDSPVFGLVIQKNPIIYRGLFSIHPNGELGVSDPSTSIIALQISRNPTVHNPEPRWSHHYLLMDL